MTRKLLQKRRQYFKMVITETQAAHVWSKPFYGGIEYKMPKLMAKRILDARHGEEAKKPNQRSLCEYVDRTFGLKGHCVKVILV